MSANSLISAVDFFCRRLCRLTSGNCACAFFVSFNQITFEQGSKSLTDCRVGAARRAALYLLTESDALSTLELVLGPWRSLRGDGVACVCRFFFFGCCCLFANPTGTRGLKWEDCSCGFWRHFGTTCVFLCSKVVVSQWIASRGRGCGAWWRQIRCRGQVGAGYLRFELNAVVKR